ESRNRITVRWLGSGGFDGVPTTDHRPLTTVLHEQAEESRKRITVKWLGSGGFDGVPTTDHRPLTTVLHGQAEESRKRITVKWLGSGGFTGVPTTNHRPPTTVLHGHRPHRRPPRTFPRAIAFRIPARSNIDIHRSITPLERPHQPDRHPQRRRNSNPPLRRVLFSGPPPLPKTLSSQP